MKRKRKWRRAGAPIVAAGILSGRISAAKADASTGVHTD
jgi:hypothetical protein